MEFIKNTKGNWELSFTSNVNVDNGITNTSIGDHKSYMELFMDDGNVPEMIEWSVYDMEDEFVSVFSIGLWFDNKDLCDYDGVFEIPKEAIMLIEKAGFTAEDHKLHLED